MRSLAACNLPHAGVEWAHLDIPIFATSDHGPRNASKTAVFPELLPPGGAKAFRNQWGAKRVGVQVAWGVATGAASKERAVTVCLVDSGVDFT